jgi:hypothetical protein
MAPRLFVSTTTLAIVFSAIFGTPVLSDIRSRENQPIDCNRPDALDDCQFLRCTCRGDFGEAAGRFVERCEVFSDGTFACECWCSREDSEESCIGGDLDMWHEGFTCERGYTVDPEEPCIGPWCQLVQELPALQDAAVILPGSGDEPGALFVAVIEDGPPTMVIGGLTDELDDHLVPAEDLPPVDRTNVMQLLCERDQDGDGVADGVFTKGEGDSWSCCRPDYGCKVCNDLTRDCVIECSSEQCHADRRQGLLPHRDTGETELPAAPEGGLIEEVGVAPPDQDDDTPELHGTSEGTETAPSSEGSHPRTRRGRRGRQVRD